METEVSKARPANKLGSRSLPEGGGCWKLSNETVNKRGDLPEPMIALLETEAKDAANKRGGSHQRDSQNGNPINNRLNNESLLSYKGEPT